MGQGDRQIELREGRIEDRVEPCQAVPRSPEQLGGLVGVTMSAIYISRILRRYRAASRPQRRILGPVYLVSVGGLAAIIAFYQGEIVSVEIPASVELTITDTEPGIQGDRVSGARKPATLQTGLVVQVPLFINPGDRVRVDTRSGEYITRV